jgi:hypothetical protein
LPAERLQRRPRVADQATDRLVLGGEGSDNVGARLGRRSQVAERAVQGRALILHARGELVQDQRQIVARPRVERAQRLVEVDRPLCLADRELASLGEHGAALVLRRPGHQLDERLTEQRLAPQHRPRVRWDRRVGGVDLDLGPGQLAILGDADDVADVDAGHPHVRLSDQLGRVAVERREAVALRLQRDRPAEAVP